MPELQVSENGQVEFGDTATKASLTEAIAVRSRSVDYLSLGNMYLPNPDPVLKSQGRDIEIYTDLVVDDRVGGSMINRLNATLSLDWQIDKGTSRKSRQAKAVQEIFGKLPLNRIIGEILQARAFGYAPLEIIWGQRDGLTVPMDVIGKPQRWFVFSSSNELRFRSRDHLMDGEELPPRKFLCPTNEASFDNPYGLGLLSRCFWPCVFKKGGWRFWVQFSEKYGQVWPIGKLPRSATKEQVAELLDVLVRMVSDGAAVIPDDGSVDFLESASKGATSALYQGVITEANNAISTVWLGHAGAGESVSGELGGKDIAIQIRDDLKASDKTLVEESLNRLIGWISEINWGTAEGSPQFSLWEEEDVDKDQAERDVNLTAAMEKSGLKLSRGYYLRTYNLEEGDIEEKQESVIAEQVPAEPSASFAEGDLDPQIPLDLLAAAIPADELQKLMAGVLAPVFKMVGESGDLTEAMGELVRLFPQMNTDALQELLARVIFVSEVWGRLSQSREPGA